MAGLLQSIGGAVLKGVGDTMIERAQQARQDALTQLGIQVKREDAATAHQYETENIDRRGLVDMAGKDHDADLQATRDATQHDYRMKESAADADNRERVARTTHDLEANDVTGTYTAEDGTVYAQSRRGLTQLPGVKGANKEDKQLLDQADAFASTTKTVTDDQGNKTQEKVTDPQKAIQFLRQKGREDLARGYFPEPPKAAVDLLRKKPELQKQFDQKYGPGAASKALGEK